MKVLLFFWSLVLIPSVLYFYMLASYLQVIRSKRDDIKRILGLKNALIFYRKAYANQDGNLDGVAEQLLKRSNYSPDSYFRAFGFIALLSDFVMVIALVRAGFPLGVPPSFAVYIMGAHAIPTILAGCAGAFIWGLYELIRRFRVGDLTPGAIYITGVRLLVMAGIGPAAALILNGRFSWAVAFGLGILPLKTLSKISSDAALRAFKAEETKSREQDPAFSYVQGAGPEIVEALEEAGVYTVTQLATTDPLRLLIRTNLDWKSIIDMIDQAFAINYIGKKIESLRLLGIRGSVELAMVHKQPHPDKLIESISVALGQSVTDVEALVSSLAWDPTQSFLAAMWSPYMEESATRSNLAVQT